MSSSTLRQFKHTFTIVAFEFVNSFAQIVAQVIEANGMINRQHEAERKSLVAMRAGLEPLIKN